MEEGDSGIKGEAETVGVCLDFVGVVALGSWVFHIHP
jgi:hypothetical protein